MCRGALHTSCARSHDAYLTFVRIHLASNQKTLTEAPNIDADRSMKPTLAMTIKARRLVRGMDQAAFASALQCDTRSVARWESGDLPSVRHLTRIRSILGIAINEMDELILDAISGEDHKVRVEGPSVLDRLNLTYDELLTTIMELELRATGIDDPTATGTATFWSMIFEALPDSWRVLTRGNRIVGIWHMVPLVPSAYEDFRTGKLSDGQLELRHVESFDLPGKFNVSLCSVVIDRPTRNQASFALMLTSLLETIQQLAERDVVFEKVCLQAWSPHVTILCHRLGFREVGSRAHALGRVSILEGQAAEILAHPALAKIQNRQSLSGIQNTH